MDELAEVDVVEFECEECGRPASGRLCEECTTLNIEKWIGLK